MFSVAIDGPSGAGKSSIAKEVAQRLGFIYVDTGALYRCVGLYLLEHGIAAKDERKVKEALKGIEVNLFHDKSGQRVRLNGRDVTDNIRTPEASMAASDCSTLPCVREFLLDLQRGLAENHNVIMDGRDIGTVVLPQADVKIFLTASAAERARRRCAQLEAGGIRASFKEVLKDIEQRDYQDSHREAAPLKMAEDAVLVDTTDMEFKTVVEKISSIITTKCGRI